MIALSDLLPTCFGSDPGPQQKAENCCDDCNVVASCTIASRAKDTQIILLYQPPCGKWYVHSHKLYPNKAAAREAARKFLSAGTRISFRKVNTEWLNNLSEII